MDTGLYDRVGENQCHETVINDQQRAGGNDEVLNCEEFHAPTNQEEKEECERN